MCVSNSQLGAGESGADSVLQQNADGTRTWVPSGSVGTGSGDVVGPSSAVNGNLAVFDGTTGKLIKDGGAPGAGGTTLDRVGSLDIVSTGTETDLYSYSVPANTLSVAGSVLVLDLFGDLLNNAGLGNDTLTLKIKYGTTTMYEDTGSWASFATRSSWHLRVVLGDATATNDQFASADFMFSTKGGATTGLGDWNASGIQFGQLSGTAAEDSTSTLTFKVTIKHSLNNAAVSFRRKFGTLRVQ